MAKQQTQPESPTDQLLTAYQAAAILQCCVRSLDSFRRRGLKFVQLGRLVRYRRQDVLEFIAANERQEAAQAA